MPELPEIELLAEKLRQGCLNKPLESIAYHPGKRADALDDGPESLSVLKGATLSDVARYGPFLFLEWGERILSLHLAGEAQVTLQRGKLDLPGGNYLLLRWQTGQQLLISAPNLSSRVRLLDESASVDYLLKLGPDPLLDAHCADHLRAAMSRRRTAIRNLLLDESFVAGIGPVWCDEILFQSRVRPDTPVAELRPAERDRILKNVHRVLERAIRCQANPSLLPKTFLTRRKQEDGLCPVCATALTEMLVGGKSASCCAKCQAGRVEVATEEGTEAKPEEGAEAKPDLMLAELAQDGLADGPESPAPGPVRDADAPVQDADDPDEPPMSAAPY